jgi:autotransporter-associated beta strand protein
MTLAGMPCAVWASPPASDYDLTFADEFHGSSLDTLKWNYNYPWGRTHNHRAYMTESQVTVSGDRLNLQAIAQRDPNAPLYVDQGGNRYYLDYTSGAVNTSGKYNFTYGYFEARIKMADIAGTWPAFWTLQNGWPPEIDVMEFPRGASNSATQYWANWHYGTGGNPQSEGWQRNAPNLTTGYNEFGVEWTADSMKFYLNGALMNSVQNTASISQAANMYMILNQAVGGWPGDPPSNTPFPSNYEIDWVRVWQKRPAGASTTSTWNIAGGGSWDTAGNWSGIVPSIGDQTARFVRVGAAPTAQVDWSSSRCVGVINFEGAASGTTAYTLGSGGGAAALELANTAGATIQALSTSAANQTINARVELYNNTTVRNDMTTGQLLAIQGSIIGNGALTIEGVGTVVFNGNNTFTGGTTIDGGGQGSAVLRASSGNALGSGSVLIGAGGNATTARLELASNVNVPNAIAFSGRNNSSAAIVNFSGNNTLSGTLTLNAGGGNYWIQSDTGTLNLAGTLTSSATGARLLTLQGAANGVISGTIQNGSATLSLVKSGSGTWTLAGSNAYSGATSVNSGKLVLASSLLTSSSMTIAPGATVELAALLRTPALTVNGRLDVRDNKVIVPGGNLAAITNLIATGRNTGGWDGNGIVTTQTSATSSDFTTLAVARPGDLGITTTSTWAGQVVSAGDVLVMYTYGGDANLDGKLNIIDYVQIDQGLASGLSGWSNGDFNYDGKINILDYVIIDSNLGNQGPPFSTSASIVAVPEPACAGGLLAAVACMRKRRHS